MTSRSKYLLMGLVELRRAVLDEVASMGVGGLSLPEGGSINLVIDRFQTLGDSMILRGFCATRQALLADPGNPELERGLRLLQSELVERGLEIPS